MSAARLIPTHVGRLLEAFEAKRDKYEAYARAEGILQDVCDEPGFITEAIRLHLARPGALGRGHYPVISFDLEMNPHFVLTVNCWIALPNGDTNLSTKAIHHHGDMLLSTATLLGPGYEHWTFAPPRRLNEEENLYELRLLGHPVHRRGQVAFIDHHVAHCPFFPPLLSLTLALWSSRRPISWKDRIKRLPPFKGREQFFRALAVRLGLTGALDLKIIRDHDFVPAGRGFRAMRDRVEFSMGPNENYLRSLFHIIQATGNDALVPDLRRLLDEGAAPDSRLFAALLADLQGGRTIAAVFSSGHTNRPDFNFRREDIQAAGQARQEPDTRSVHAR